MKINSLIIFISIIIIIIGGILIANKLGLYETSRPSTPKKTLSGEYDIADIRGSHTFAEIEKFYKVNFKDVIEAFGLPENINPNVTKIKDFTEIFKPVEINGKEYQFETEGFRVFVALYLLKEYNPSEEVFLPSRTVSFLIKNNKLTESQISYWREHQFKPVYYSENETPLNNEEGELKITGQTTIKELLKLGINKEQFKEITGLNLPEDTNIILKDFLSEKEIPFKDVKEKFTEILEKK